MHVAISLRLLQKLAMVLLGLSAITAGIAAGGAGCGLAAQERDNDPTVHVTYPNFVFPSEPCTFTPEHFGNTRAYFWSANGVRVMSSGTLTGGKYERNETTDAGSTSVELASVQRPTAARGDSPFAIVSYYWEWLGGSSSQSNVVQVFGCRNGHLLVLQQISNDAHSQHAGTDYDPQTRVLTVKSVRYGAGAHCCPEELDVVAFRWTGARFEQTGWKTVPMPK